MGDKGGSLNKVSASSGVPGPHCSHCCFHPVLERGAAGREEARACPRSPRLPDPSEAAAAWALPAGKNTSQRRLCVGPSCPCCCSRAAAGAHGGVAGGRAGSGPAQGLVKGELFSTATREDGHPAITGSWLPEWELGCLHADL